MVSKIYFIGDGLVFAGCKKFLQKANIAIEHIVVLKKDIPKCSENEVIYVYVEKKNVSIKWALYAIFLSVVGCENRQADIVILSFSKPDSLYSYSPYLKNFRFIQLPFLEIIQTGTGSKKIEEIAHHEQFIISQLKHDSGGGKLSEKIITNTKKYLYGH